jgi:hypothetical protein
MDLRRGLRLLGRMVLALLFVWLIAVFLSLLSFPSIDDGTGSSLPAFLAVPASFVAVLPFMIPRVEPLVLACAYMLLLTAAAGMAFLSDTEETVLKREP